MIIDNQLDEEILALSRMIYLAMGAGLREKVYQNGFNLLLNDNHKTILEYPISIKFREHCLSLCYPDILLMYQGQKILIEVKAISKLQLKEQLQLKGYMRHSGISTGYLINFGIRELEVVKYVGDEEIELI
jgi:GxxExxY protein